MRQHGMESLSVVKNPATRRKGLLAFVSVLLAVGAVGAVTSNASAALVPPSPAAAVAPPTSYSIWADSDGPAGPADSDARPAELGVRFSSQSDGWVLGVRYYKMNEAAASTRGTLWTVGGDVLAQVNFSAASGAGWQKATFDAPVKISAGTTYVASYSAPAGHYADDSGVLSVTNATATKDLTAVAGVYSYGAGVPQQTWKDSNYYADVVFATAKPTLPSTTATPTTATPAPSTTATPTTATPASPASTGFPDATNTGVPTGVTLSSYTGPCTITASNTVISGKLIGCDLVIKAAGVSVTNSRINGRLVSNTSGASVVVQDSEINGGNQETFPSVSYQNLTLRRVEVTGGQHSVQCSANCTVADSWLHNQYIGAGSTGHVNAFISNGGSGFTLTHNTLHCTVQPTGTGGGCTADASVFGDFGPISNAQFSNNLFKANNTGAGYCLQAGYNPGKAYPNPTGVVVTNNVFERGSNGMCGIYGPVTAFLAGGAGNTWSGNTFDNGAAVNP